MSTEFSFTHTVRTIVPAEAFSIVVTAVIEREDFGCEMGFDIPVGISSSAMAQLALEYHLVAGRAWEIWRERQEELQFERMEAGVAGTEPSEEAS